jgi:transposase
VLSLGTTGHIYLAVDPQDGRKGIDGLAGVVTAALGRDPASGDLFVFKNKKGDRLKILAWEGDGFALYLRRLECGTFAFPPATGTELAVTPTQLAMILGGLDPAHARRRKRYARPTHPAESTRPDQSA